MRRAAQGFMLVHDVLALIKRQAVSNHHVDTIVTTVARELHVEPKIIYFTVVVNHEHCIG